MIPLPVAPTVDRDDSPREKCGVLGIYAPDKEAARLAFFGLFALQHRGQESAGIAVSNGRKVKAVMGMGLVNQVFTEQKISRLRGHLGVGHNRYSTTGGKILRNAQPILCPSALGEVAVAHNGNLVNTKELREEMRKEGFVIDKDSDSDSLLIALLVAKHIKEGPEAAVRVVMERCQGAYSVTVLVQNMVIGFRDPYGVRPLVAGTLGAGYFIASETCAFGPVGAVPLREVAPGEMVVIGPDGMKFSQVVAPKGRHMCLFEFIYFARPDSTMYGTRLYSARERMGMQLAREAPVEADIVIPVPDSGIPAALGFSEVSGIPFREGMMKSRYIHRTFIQPSQSMREIGVRLKLSPLEDHIKGKRVVLVDDSIVRGTTTKQIVKLLFDSGAQEVHVRITAPPIKNPCFYGIDMATRAQLIADNLSLDELTKYIGASSLAYLSIKGAAEAVGGTDDGFCLACFNNQYPIPIPAHLMEAAEGKRHTVPPGTEVGNED